MNTCSNIPALAQEQINRIASECSGKDIKVVINCITYNHGPYLADALEGFVKQQTNFPFVAIVHDDASTDNTAEVLREYAERYPDIIKPIYEKENQYSKGNGTLSRIMNIACEVTGARYLAHCEGDDYWTDSHKLQIQVDFLEENPDYSMCFHNAIVIEDGRGEANNQFALNETREYTADQITEKWIVPTASIVHRTENILNSPLRANKRFKYGDHVLMMTCAKYGKLYGINEYMSVYRRNPSSITVRLSSLEWLKMDVVHFRAESKVFHDVISRKLRRDSLAARYYDLMRAVKGNPGELIRYSFEAIYYCTPEIWIYIWKTIRRKTRN